MQEVKIVGAGPVGAYLAWKLAEQGVATKLIEEHAVIGAPVQCTGILTDDILKSMPKKDIKSITKTIVTKTVVHSPNKKTQMGISPNYIIDNIAYCKLLAQKAQDAGAQIQLLTRYVKNSSKKVTFKDVKNKQLREEKCSVLVGADGPTSLVAKNNKLYDNSRRMFLTGVQAVVKMKKDQYDNKIHFWPYIGEYAWYCPEGEGRARIGLAARSNAKAIFDDFMKKFKGKVECMQGGPIPLFKPKPKVQKDHKNMSVQLIGDSVPQIKNTTGGGIIPGTKAADIYVKDPANYANNLGPLNRELYAHYMINKTLQKFNAHDWDKLITQAKDRKVKKVLKETNRDNALALATKLFMAKPSFSLWGKKLLTS